MPEEESIRCQPVMGLYLSLVSGPVSVSHRRTRAQQPLQAHLRLAYLWSIMRCGGQQQMGKCNSCVPKVPRACWSYGDPG